jgi:trimeric autotransporter adhesin
VKFALRLCVVVLVTLCCAFAQQSPATSVAAVVPTLMNFSGTLSDGNGKPLIGVIGVTFSLYKDEQSGAPLWMETQNVRPDGTGHYTVALGSTRHTGLPADIFAAGEARWLGVQAQGRPEGRRVMLLSVPYALKAGDAQTVGGLPPSAFVMAGAAAAQSATPSAASNAVTPPTASNVTTAGGTVATLPLFTSATNIEDSAISQVGSGASAKIGINTVTPSVTLDVKGAENVRGTLTLTATGGATSAGGKNSQPQSLVASAFNSSTSTAVNQNFRWQAEPAANNSSTPSATLNLLFGQGGGAPAETGLKIDHAGVIAFAPNQTFPGTGTVTGVAAGTGLTGGGTSGNVALNLDTAVVPRLNVSNLFTADQGIAGSLTAGVTVSARTVNATSFYEINSQAFAFGSSSTGNVFLGFAGNVATTGSSNVGLGRSALIALTTGTDNTALGDETLSSSAKANDNTAVGFEALLTTTTGGGNTAIGSNAMVSNRDGFQNTASGFNALAHNSSGMQNTADGAGALGSETTGIGNTAVGADALQANTSGGENTALGLEAGPSTSSPALFNSTAIGAFAQVTQSNSLVLGSISGVNQASADTSVGIGTTAPKFKLHIGVGNRAFRVEGPAQGTTSPVLASFGGTGDFSIDAVNTGGGRFVVKNNGDVGIGTPNPDSLLSVNGSADKPGGGSWGTFSDGRLKTLHGTFNAGLFELLQLQPIRYSYKPDNAMGINDREEHVGFVAQDVEKVIPEAVHQNDRGYRIVNNDPILWTMLNAIKEQQEEIALLKQKIEKLDAAQTTPQP